VTPSEATQATKRMLSTGLTGPPNCPTENLAPNERDHSPNFALCGRLQDFGEANLRNFRDNFGERDFSGKASD